MRKLGKFCFGMIVFGWFLFILLTGWGWYQEASIRVIIMLTGFSVCIIGTIYFGQYGDPVYDKKLIELQKKTTIEHDLYIEARTMLEDYVLKEQLKKEKQKQKDVK